ncbi:hypothetical protein CPC16_000930 [Podila verticillata]|nr:hypothetical protein BGZ52_003870 [Haplosporangium bisporale]KAF9393874.1 hypothetical protein CPC16_000930 [Podila verticillata]KFH73681.1 hypothetical protein MVEG_00895 [Podila verticillata NRRL 6337]
MKFFAVIVALAFAALVSTQTPVITSCATPGTTDLIINSFTISPYPLCINQNVCATGTGTLLTDVIAPAKLAISGKFLGRVVYTDNQDLCAITAAAGMPCPIDTTHTSITACVLVKPSAPANVNVQLTVQATNGNNRILFCQAATVVANNCT